MQKLKPSVAFALGLWAGTLLAAAAGWMWWQSELPDQFHGADAAPTAAADQQLRQLRADIARLTAENERLRQTLEFFRQDVAEPPAAPAPATPAGATAADDQPAKDAPVNLAQLEARALQNDLAAVTAVGDAAPQDHGEALLRVWNSGKLELAGQRHAAWYLGTMIEANPKTLEALRALFADPNADPELWLSALDGLATRSPTTTDYHIRVDLLVELEETAAPSLRSQIETTRKQLLRHWADTEHRRER